MDELTLGDIQREVARQALCDSIEVPAKRATQ